MNKKNSLMALALILLFEGGLRLITPLLFEVKYKKGRAIDNPKKLLRPYPHAGFGYTLLPHLDVKFKGKKFTTDKNGFRGIPLQPPGKLKIIGLGDSVMMGWGVSNKETYLHLIGEQLRLNNKSVKTYNLGVLGYNAFQEYFYFLEKGLPLKPDLVILQYVGNDFEETKNRLGTLPVNSPSYLLNAFQYAFMKIFQQLDREKNYDWRPVKNIEEVKQSQDNLIWAYVQLFKRCEKEKIPLLLVLDSRYISWGGKHSELERLADQFGVKTINLFKQYRNLEESISVDEAVSIDDEHNQTLIIEKGAGKDNHPNALWHSKTAKLLAPEVLNLLTPL
jgi:hypothetical protein